MLNTYKTKTAPELSGAVLLFKGLVFHIHDFP